MPTAARLWPTARSGCGVAVHGDALYVYGGYSKVHAVGVAWQCTVTPWTCTAATVRYTLAAGLCGCPSNFCAAMWHAWCFIHAEPLQHLYTCSQLASSLEATTNHMFIHRLCVKE